MLKLDGLEIRAGTFSLSADLEIERHARIALLGPSGAGKSRLLSAIGGFITPAAGRILIDGHDVTGTAPGDRPVATLFQDGNLFPHLSAVENVGLALRPDLRLSRGDRNAAEAALDRVGLAGMGARKPAALSGGQQSRVALARVLLQGRAILALDEPFAALGPALKAGMLDLVAEVADETGAILLMVTHDPEDARRISRQVILVADGAALAPRPTQALLDDPPPVLRAYLGDARRPG